jgi:hypothetical protein
MEETNRTSPILIKACIRKIQDIMRISLCFTSQSNRYIVSSIINQLNQDIIKVAYSFTCLSITGDFNLKIFVTYFCVKISIKTYYTTYYRTHQRCIKRSSLLGI